MVEMLDIINAQDEVIGSDTFERVHQNRQLHRFTRIVLENSEGEFVLHRRHWNGKREIRLDTAGGHVRSGETYLEGGVRELQEEMGVKAPLTEIGKIECHIDDEYKWEGMLGRVFVAVHDGPYSHDDEVIDVKTLSREDAYTIMKEAPDQMTPQLVNALHCFKTHKEK